MVILKNKQFIVKGTDEAKKKVQNALVRLGLQKINASPDIEHISTKGPEEPNETTYTFTLTGPAPTVEVVRKVFTDNHMKITKES